MAPRALLSSDLTVENYSAFGKSDRWNPKEGDFTATLQRIAREIVSGRRRGGRNDRVKARKRTLESPAAAAFFDFLRRDFRCLMTAAWPAASPA